MLKQATLEEQSDIIISINTDNTILFYVIVFYLNQLSFLLNIFFQLFSEFVQNELQ